MVTYEGMSTDELLNQISQYQKKKDMLSPYINQYTKDQLNQLSDDDLIKWDNQRQQLEQVNQTLDDLQKEYESRSAPKPTNTEDEVPLDELLGKIDTYKKQTKQFDPNVYNYSNYQLNNLSDEELINWDKQRQQWEQANKTLEDLQNEYDKLSAARSESQTAYQKNKQTASYKNIVPYKAGTAYTPSDDDLMTQLNVQAYLEEQEEEYKKKNPFMRTREDLTAERARLEDEFRNYSDYGIGAHMSDDEIMAKTDRLNTLWNTDMRSAPVAKKEQPNLPNDYFTQAYGDSLQKQLESVKRELMPYGEYMDFPNLLFPKVSRARFAELNEQKNTLESQYNQWKSNFYYYQKYYESQLMQQQATASSDYTDYVKQGLAADNKVEKVNRDFTVDQAGNIRMPELNLNSKDTPSIYLQPQDADLLYISEQERQVYAYYLAKDGAKKAQEYLDALESTLNARMTGDIAKKKELFAEEHPVEGIVTSTLSSLGSAKAMIPIIEQSAKNLLGQEDKPVDTNSAWFGGINSANASAKGVQQAAYLAAGGGTQGDIASWYAGNAISILQNIARLPLGEQGALSIMAADAAGQMATDMLNRGGTPEQALTMGTVAGFVEYATEKLPMHKLFELGSSDIGSVRKYIEKVLLEQGMTELGEEMVSNLADTAAQIAIMGDKSDYWQTVDSYQKQGYTKEEAEKKAFADRFINDTIQQGLGGYLSGVILGSGEAAIGTVNQSENKQGTSRTATEATQSSGTAAQEAVRGNLSVVESPEAEGRQTEVPVLAGAENRFSAPATQSTGSAAAKAPDLNVPDIGQSQLAFQRKQAAQAAGLKPVRVMDIGEAVVFPEAHYDTQMSAVAQSNMDKGYKTVYFLDDLPVKVGDATLPSRGFMDLKNGTMYLKANDGVSVESLAKHEEYHAKSALNPGKTKLILAEVAKQTTPGSLETMVQKYQEAYNGCYGSSPYAYLDEIAADAYANINGMGGLISEIKDADGLTTHVESVETAGAGSRDADGAALLWQELGTNSPYFRDYYDGNAPEMYGQDGEPITVYHKTASPIEALDTAKRGEYSPCGRREIGLFLYE